MTPLHPRTSSCQLTPALPETQACHRILQRYMSHSAVLRWDSENGLLCQEELSSHAALLDTKQHMIAFFNF